MEEELTGVAQVWTGAVASGPPCGDGVSGQTGSLIVITGFATEASALSGVRGLGNKVVALEGIVITEIAIGLSMALKQFWILPTTALSF